MTSTTRLLVVLLVLSLLSSISVPLQAQESGCAPSRLEEGGLGQVTPGDPNNLRAEPSPNAELLGAIPGEGTFTVGAEPPQCIDGLLWMQVIYGNLTGWTVENTNGEYWLEPLSNPIDTSGNCGSLFTVGQTGEQIMSIFDVDIHSNPSYESRIVGAITGNATFSVIGEATCVDPDRTWLQISFEGIEGWIVERDIRYCDGNYGCDYFVYRSVRPTLNPLPAVSEMPPLTPAVLTENAITIENASGVTLERIVGDGEIIDFAWSPDETSIAMASSRDVQILNPRQLNTPPRSLTEHEGALTAVRYSPDGSLLATSDNLGAVILWDTESYTPVHILQHEAVVTTLAFTPDGQYLASAEAPNKVSLWLLSADSPEQIATFETQGSNELQFTPDGERLISTGYKSVDVIDVAARSSIFSDDMHGFDVTDYELSPTGTRLYVYYSFDLTAPAEGTLVNIFNRTGSWTLVRGSFTDELNPYDYVYYPELSLTIDPDGQGSVQNYGDRQRIDFGEPGSRREVQVPGVTHVVYSPDSTAVALATLDGVVHIYGAGGYIDALYGITGRIEDVQFSPDGRFIAARGEDYSLRVWEIESRQRIGTRSLIPFGRAFTLSSNEQQAVSDGQLWDLTNGTPITILKAEGVNEHTIVYRETGEWVGINSSDIPAFWVDIITGETLDEVVAPVTQFTEWFFYKSSGMWTAVLEADEEEDTRSLVVFDAKTGQVRQRFERYYEAVSILQLSPNGDFVLVNAFVDNYGTEGLYLWHTRDGALLVEITPEDNTAIDNSIFSGDSTHISWTEITGSQSDVKIMALSTGDVVTFPYRKKASAGMVLNPDGSILAVPDSNFDILLYDTTSGDLLHTLTGHTATVTTLQFNADGTRLYSASADGTLRIWSIGAQQ